ncbi:MAG: hypothetical protein LQ350_005137 [Teloschistes chrysophthalmus]|nr:MAG: hypothetical protein LQ350_005137 [Niorma chrysophthalma]
MAPKIILITGANSGVGYAATKVLTNASPDFHVIMAGRSLSKIEAALAEISSTDIKGKLTPLHLDVTDEASVNEAAQFVEEKFGHLDALVNNAAIGSMDPNAKTRMQLSVDTNVVAPAVVASAFRPLLLKSENPYSVYVSSGMGSLTMAAGQDLAHYRPVPYEEAYRSSKAALNMIAFLEHKQFGSRGLKTFAMCPGFVVSNLRGKSEEARSGSMFGAEADDPEVSGRLLMSILTGDRDADVGKFVHKGGVYPW